jgi:predicted transglutaminase-like cysteine proteinase
VNRLVNRSVEPATDSEIYGISEYWTLPGDKGDCEDYALLKQKILIGRGWPSSSLLLTVVRDEKGEGHAVLTARTSQGDFVLDNKSDDVRLWSRSSYQFVMRQSYLDPKVWVSLDPQDAGAPSSLAGVQDDR